KSFGELFAHSDRLRTLSGETPGDAHRLVLGHILTSALPHEIPAPSAHMSTVWPGLIRPSLIASSRAMGIEALDVLPYRSMLMTNRSGGMSRRLATCVKMRRLAWCATTQSMSPAERPAASIAALDAEVRLRTATLKTSLPCIWTLFFASSSPAWVSGRSL